MVLLEPKDSLFASACNSSFASVGWCPGIWPAQTAGLPGVEARGDFTGLLVGDLNMQRCTFAYSTVVHSCCVLLYRVGQIYVYINSCIICFIFKYISYMIHIYISAHLSLHICIYTYWHGEVLIPLAGMLFSSLLYIKEAVFLSTCDSGHVLLKSWFVTIVSWYIPHMFKAIYMSLLRKGCFLVGVGSC